MDMEGLQGKSVFCANSFLLGLFLSLLSFFFFFFLFLVFDF